MAGPVTLKHAFEKEGDPEHLGGTEYMAELASSVIKMMNAEDEGHTIGDLYMRRELIVLGQDLRRHACKPRPGQEHIAMAIIEPTEGRPFRLAEAGNTGGRVQTFSEMLRQATESDRLPLHHDSSVTGVTTGLRCLDRRLSGLQSSDLMTLAGQACARPRLPPGRTLTASPTDIGGHVAQRHVQTQGRGPV
jgi:replicative DNA helicase